MEPDEKSPAVRAYEQNLARIYELVFQLFNDDNKTHIWLRTPNPMLGDISPRDMLRMGRYGRLLRFVTHAIEEGRLDRPVEVLEGTGGC
jgi:uncharacterized protein (DUF2384 family)